MTKAIIDISTNIAKIGEIVRRHDEQTFPEMQRDIKEVKDSNTRMESKQNEDMVRFIKEKEDIYSRIKPLETDLAKRLEKEKDVNSRVKSILWGAIEKLFYIVIGTFVAYWVSFKEIIFFK